MQELKLDWRIFVSLWHWQPFLLLRWHNFYEQDCQDDTSFASLHLLLIQEINVDNSWLRAVGKKQNKTNKQTNKQSNDKDPALTKKKKKAMIRKPLYWDNLLKQYTNVSLPPWWVELRMHTACITKSRTGKSNKEILKKFKAATFSDSSF